MSSDSYSLAGIPRPGAASGPVKVAPPPDPPGSAPRPVSALTAPKPLDNSPRPQSHLPSPSHLLTTTSRTNDLTSIMSGLSLAHSRPTTSSHSYPQSQGQHPTNAPKLPTATSTTNKTSVSDDNDDDDDDIQILSTSTRPPSSSYHSPSETKAALRALNKLVSTFTGPLSMSQVDAIQAILYPPTRPTESMSVTDDVLSELAHITAFPGTRLARAAEHDADPTPDAGGSGDPSLIASRPTAKPGDALVKVAPGRSLAHRALAMKLAEHRRRKEEERNGTGDASGTFAPATPGIKAEMPSRSSRMAVPGTPAAVAGAGTVPSTDVKPSVIKREPVDALDRVLLEVSVKTKAAMGGSSKLVGLGADSRLGGVGAGASQLPQPQQPGKRRLVKPVQPPTL